MPIDKEGFETHTFMCIKCAQTRVVRHKPELDPDSVKWHDCDPENINHPRRKIDADLWRVLGLISGKPINIGGISAEESAYNDIVRRSTKIY